MRAAPSLVMVIRSHWPDQAGVATRHSGAYWAPSVSDSLAPARRCTDGGGVSNAPTS